MGIMLRLMIIAAIIWFVYAFIRRTFALNQPPATPPTSGALMKQCAQCGIHIPEGESTQSQGHYFCCEAHRDRFLNIKS